MAEEEVAVECGIVSHTITREEDGVVHERRVLASGERVEVFYKSPTPQPRTGRAATFHDFTVPAAAAVPGPEAGPGPEPPLVDHQRNGGETTSSAGAGDGETGDPASPEGQHGAPTSADFLSLSSLTGRMAAMAPSWMKSEVTSGGKMRFKEDVCDGDAETLTEPPRWFMMSFVFIYYLGYLTLLGLISFGFNPLFLPTFVPVGAKVLQEKGHKFGVPLSYGCPANPFCEVYTLIPAVVINGVTYFPNNTDSLGGRGRFEAAALHVATLFEAGCSNLQAETNRKRTFNITGADSRVERRLVQDMQRALAGAAMVLHHHCHYETYYLFDRTSPDFGSIPKPNFRDVLSGGSSTGTNCTGTLAPAGKVKMQQRDTKRTQPKQCHIDRLSDRSFPAYLEEVMYVVVQ
ncbi:BDLF2 [Macacine gammaherpesvirus 4]|uniref:BDLF2 n=1 Tax=Macacine gammaherpesvirus 4 TaxID=45455 RepID=Q8UZF2_9GAMA|nr:BDLF2 [Macacine gammaherpesvirus 4]AAK95459.1 BDLF2 [Macacine gammaherpesvirus 4]